MKMLYDIAGAAPRLAALALLLPLAFGPGTAGAQTATAAARTPFARYLEAVENHSLDLAAQRETITSAQAGVSIAGVRPDPQLTYGLASKELYTPNKPNAANSMTAGLALTIETGGKRDRRIRAAQSNVRLTEATVESFRRQLFNDAASSFAEACRANQALVRQEDSLQALSDVVRMNERRKKAGDIGGLELAQSRVERDRFTADVTSARAAAQTALINLSVPLGRRYSDLFPEASLDCEFKAYTPAGDPEALVAQALKQRDDVLVAQAALENARDQAQLAHANRWVDPTFNVGISQTPRINPIYGPEGDVINSPAEKSKTLSLTVTLPIPVSRLQKGELIQAESAVTQAMLTLRSVELKAESDVRATYGQFVAARENVRRYRESVLLDADRVLDGMRQAYRRGAASLLELLNAQRDADDTYLAYLQANADLATATVQLQLSLGLRPTL